MGTRITLPFLVKPVGSGEYHDGSWCYDQFDVVVGGGVGVQLPIVSIELSGGNLGLSTDQLLKIERRLFTIANEELLTAVLRETVRCQSVQDSATDPESTVKGK